MNKNKSIMGNLIVVLIYSIAMALLESSVVVYLRELYYPNGFQFPLNAVSRDLSMVEISREFATLIMLLTIAVLSAETWLKRFAYFLISFAIWDIFYYIFLYIFIKWPMNILEWDILFLIPTVWTGPVISPVILAVLMLVLGGAILHFNRKWDAPLTKTHWTGLLLGSILALGAFMYDFISFALDHFGKLSAIPLDPDVWIHLYSPGAFPWVLFLISCGIITTSILLYINSHRISNKQLVHSQFI